MKDTEGLVLRIDVRSVWGVCFCLTLKKITDLYSASRNANPENQTAGARPRGMAMINGKIGCELATATLIFSVCFVWLRLVMFVGRQIQATRVRKKKSGDHTMGIGNKAQCSQQQNALRCLHDEC